LKVKIAKHKKQKMSKRNVEIKAKIKDYDETIQLISDLIKPADVSYETIHQHDTFFNVNGDGLLKLRDFQTVKNTGELIYYERSIQAGPKLSSYVITPVSNCGTMRLLLEKSNGIIGTVVKTRHLFLHGQTRIHVDKVQTLGNFLELEVVLTPTQTAEEGEIIAEEIMSKLNISEDDLVPTAYLDLILSA
jgi:predicted adenylyl cyclase CyaB